MDGVTPGIREDDIEMASSSSFYFSWTRTANCSCVESSLCVSLLGDNELRRVEGVHLCMRVPSGP